MGPPNCANGGYTCGLVGTAVKAPAVRVSLVKPPPLDVPLLRRREDDGSVSLLSGDDVIATAVPGAVPAQAPPAPTVEETEIAMRRYGGFTHHRFPTCFICGTARDDGLRIYASQVGDRALIAFPWMPQAGDPPVAWAVLDCPSVYAIESVDQRLYAADRLPAGCGQAIAPARTGGPGISRRADQPAQTPSQLAQTGVGEPSTNLAGNDIPR